MPNSQNRYIRISKNILVKDIQMVDLKGQYAKIKEAVDNSVINVIESSAYINGPEVVKFAEELKDYLDVKHVIPCGNGTDALQISMMAMGLKPGDEVITADFTFVATAEVIALLGLTPVLVDVDADTYNINIDGLRKAITPNTKAIVPVHLFGQCANMDAIMEIAKEFNLKVIEDTAQAIGANFTSTEGWSKKAGTIGDIGCTSFFPSKNLGCYGDGGAIFTNDDTIADKIRVMANHGMKVRYYHDEVGVNSRLDSIQAAILRIKLPLLDGYCAARHSAAMKYNKAFENIAQIETPITASYSNHVFHQYTMKISGTDRAELQKKLMDKGIPAMIYYPVPLHAQKAYADERYKEEDFEITNKLCSCVLSLPMHTELSDEQIDYITSSVIQAINN
ncbi:MAG: UDP-2-acetamido-2-deoxy-ribo-hexuluronate aminotransferase [Flavobacteriales bacterium]|jgi:UDP-2-acetamido-2-deoxy-ribo-hexuluronate aminotransferase